MARLGDQTGSIQDGAGLTTGNAWRHWLRMDAKPQQMQLVADLTKLLAGNMPGMEIDVSYSDRWKRDCVTFVWEGFTDLLPEERFHRLIQAIPEAFRTTRLKGLVWLELAPGEAIDEFMAYPRSEDVAPRESSIYAGLLDTDFFDAIDAGLGPLPKETCQGDFAMMARILTSLKFTDAQIRDAKLVFIRHGAYCDCQVYFTAQQELAKLYVGAA